MSTVCFIHDSRLIEDEVSGDVYSQSFRYSLWERYLEVFDSLIVCTRMEQGQAPSGMGLSSGDGVTFVPADSYKGPLSFLRRLPTIYKQVADAVSSADTVLLRLPSMLGIFGYIASRRSGTDYIVELVGSPRDAYANRSFLGRVIAPVMTAVTRRVVRHAPYCIYVTESYLQEHYPTCGKEVSISDVEIDTSYQPIVRQGPSYPIRIGSVGQVDVPYKGHKTIISALPDLPEIEYHIAGGGDQTELLAYAESLGVQNRLKFKGLLDRDELFDWLDSLDLYVQPSFTEGLPRAVVEALSRGLPVLATSVGGLPELVPARFLFEPGDSRGFKRKLLETLNQESFAEISATNYRRSQDFDFRVLQKQRKEFLLEFKTAALSKAVGTTSRD